MTDLQDAFPLFDEFDIAISGRWLRTGRTWRDVRRPPVQRQS
jgi:hypothetical protein